MSRLDEAQDALVALTLSAMGGRFTEDEQATYDALCNEIERLERVVPAATEREVPT